MMKVAVAFDHRGVRLREAVLSGGRRRGLRGRSIWESRTRAFASTIPTRPPRSHEAIRSGDAERGILVCGSGVGACVAVGKVPGIRAAICHDAYSAHQGVEHDDMNVLCLGSEIVGGALASELVRAFLGARFNESDERYAERLRKVEQMERDAARELA